MLSAIATRKEFPASHGQLWGTMHRPWVYDVPGLIASKRGVVSVPGRLSRCIARANVVQEVAYPSPVLDLALQRQAMQLLGGLGQRSLVEEAVVA